MHTIKKWSPIVLVVLAAVTLVIVNYTGKPVEAAKPIRCPDIYAPVTCDNGKTYPNQCYADLRHAKNCVPTGELSTN